ncbi:helix-turn-helix domain-containing protein [Empedobacter brevis]
MNTESPQIAVLHIPVTEWNDLKQTLSSLQKQLSKVADKEESELLTIPEAMKKLKVGRSTILRYLENGLLQATRIGGKGTKQYISLKEINHALENGII